LAGIDQVERRDPDGEQRGEQRRGVQATRGGERTGGTGCGDHQRA
jgi:hypothetical protein